MREGDVTGGKAGRRRRLNEGRIGCFAEELDAWSFDEERAMGAEGTGHVRLGIPLGGGAEELPR